MSEPRSRNWLKISCIGCVGLPCLGLMFTFGFIKCQISKEGENLAPELAKLRAMGIPTEPEDLRPNPPISDSQNAAPVYEKIASADKSSSNLASKRERDLISQYSGFPGDLADYRAALKKYEPVFALIETLPTKPGFDMKRDYSKGFLTEFEEFAQMKNVVKMLATRTQFWIDEKKYDRALKDLETQYIIANHLSEEVTLIGALVNIAIGAIADASLDRLLSAIQNNQPMLAKTEAMLVKRLKAPNLRRAFYGEMVLGRVGIQTMESWRAVTSSMFDEDIELSGLEASWDRMTIGDPAVKKMLEARSVAMWRELFEKFPKDDLDWQGFKKAFQEVDAKVQADNSLQNKLNQILFPVFDQASLAFAKSVAQQRVSLLNVKLLRARAPGLPSNLSQFGKLAVDPMDGKPMRYLRKGNAFKVWSIGQDLVDQGGKPRKPGSSDRDFDIVKGTGMGLPSPVIRPVGSAGSSFSGGPGAPPGFP